MELTREQVNALFAAGWPGIKDEVLQALHNAALRGLEAQKPKAIVRAALEAAAQHVEYKGTCTVAMINGEERLVEKKAYAWDCDQHAYTIRALATPEGIERILREVK